VERSPRSGRSATRGPRAPRAPRPEGAEELLHTLPRLLRALALGACITLPVGLALAQRALDANLRVGSGGRNSYNSSAFPVSAPSPFTVNRNTGEMTHNWANAVNERPGGVYSSAFRRSGGDIALGRGDFAPAPPPRQNFQSGLSRQNYSTMNVSSGGAPPVSTRAPRGVSGLQNQSYSPLAAPLTPAAAKPADPAKSLQRGTYTPIR